MASESASKEKYCDGHHPTIEDAIHHARTSLGGPDVEPFWGGMSNINPGRVVGYQVTARKRWRLDFDPQKGVHVNEENFELPPSKQKIVHRVDLANSNDMQVRLYWNKWTTRYGAPGRGTYCQGCQNWHITGRCPFGLR
jgi:hypothetical protein